MHITVPTVHCTVHYRGEVAAPMTDLKECRIQEFQTRRTEGQIHRRVLVWPVYMFSLECSSDENEPMFLHHID